jgi:hypothetical protein
MVSQSYQVNRASVCLRDELSTRFPRRPTRTFLLARREIMAEEYRQTCCELIDVKLDFI